MTYETAKKLKNAGFPFTWDYEPQSLAFKQYPTLSELIDACGDMFDSLEKRGGVYFAFGSSKDSAMLKIDPYREVGSTPGEAVANLWLSLNWKKD